MKTVIAMSSSGSARGGGRRRRVLLLVAASVFVTSTAMAQSPGGEMRITVVDDVGQPVEGAAVSVDKQIVGATSADGGLAVPLAPGQHVTSVDASGYQGSESTIIVAAGQYTPVRYTLTDMTVGGEVINIVMRSPEKTVNVPATVGMINGEQIKATVSFQEGLKNVMGVDVYSGGVGTSRVSTRGFYSHTNQRMAFMVDGHVAQTPAVGVGLGDSAPVSPLDMRYVEVVSGPSSAQYGANAVGGVLDVRTKSPWDKSGVTMMARYGSQDLVEGAARLAGTLGDAFGWKMNVQYLTAEDRLPSRADPAYGYGTMLHETQFIDDYSVQQFKLDGAAYFRLDNGLHGKASSGYARAEGFQVTPTGRMHLRNSYVLMNVAQLKDDDWFLNLAHTKTSAGNSYNIGSSVQMAAAMGGVPVDEAGREAIRRFNAVNDESQLYTLDGQYSHDIGFVGLTLGSEARLYLPDSNGTVLADSQGVDLKTAQAGLFVQGDARFADDRLRIVGAARVDVHDYYGATFTPKLVGSFEIQPNHVVRVGASRAHRSPSIAESFLYSANGAVQGNRSGFQIRTADGQVVRDIPALEPEVSTALEAGYKGIFARGLYGEIVGHYTFHESFISPLLPFASPHGPVPTFAFDNEGQMVADGTLLTFFNFGRAQVAGGDVRAAYESEHFLASASASYLRLVQRTKGDLDDKELILNVPAVKTVTTVGVKDLGAPGWFARVDGRFRSAFTFQSGYWSSTAMGLPDGKLPSRFVIDATLGYQIPGTGVELTVVGSNILDDETLEVLGSPAPRRLVFFQLEYDGNGLQF